MFDPADIIEISSDSDVSTSENSVDCRREAFKCTKCSEAFRYPGMLDRHMWTHMCKSQEWSEKEQLLQCEYCDKVLPALSMKRHVRQVHEHESFHCDKCQKFWMSSATFNVHRRKKHSEDVRSVKKIYMCEKCGVTFESHSGLIGHKKSHLARVTYWCDFCMRKFHVKPHLRAHVQIHIKTKPHGCHLCKSTFRRADYLRKHMKRHECKTFRCTHCKKTFEFEKTLKRHLKTHPETTKRVLVDYSVD